MFNYTDETIANIEESISAERLGTYLSETSNNKLEALELYLKNAKISADFYLPLQSLEVTLRNKLHTVLSEHFGQEDWYELPILNDRGQKNILDAKRTVKRLHQEVNAPHVVAELSFGFWLSLLNKKYHQSLWIPALNKAFPNARMKRADILRDLDHLRTFRNRIAHHEPVFKRHLEQDFNTTITAISWMCKDTADWTKENCSSGA